MGCVSSGSTEVPGHRHHGSALRPTAMCAGRVEAPAGACGGLGDPEGIRWALDPLRARGPRRSAWQANAPWPIVSADA